jgi:3-methyl-2-oxobutanoate hydroxymethyltransferase
MEQAGAAAILLEAVPPELSKAIVERTSIPVIGCGAGSACHGSVVVTHDMLGLSGNHRPKFVPVMADIAKPLTDAMAEYVKQVSTGRYPAPEHQYQMPDDERAEFVRRLRG